ncbi:MAG: hypothetical protein R3321_11670 [Nitrososphaeraceae archaeon]|nr:hypothetical protein [Nitrososphaeraceae archaeon]
MKKTIIQIGKLLNLHAFYEATPDEFQKKLTDLHSLESSLEKFVALSLLIDKENDFPTSLHLTILVYLYKKAIAELADYRIENVPDDTYEKYCLVQIELADSLSLNEFLGYTVESVTSEIIEENDFFNVLLLSALLKCDYNIESKSYIEFSQNMIEASICESYIQEFLVLYALILVYGIMSERLFLKMEELYLEAVSEISAMQNEDSQVYVVDFLVENIEEEGRIESLEYLKAMLAKCVAECKILQLRKMVNEK